MIGNVVGSLARPRRLAISGPLPEVQRFCRDDSNQSEYLYHHGDTNMGDKGSKDKAKKEKQKKAVYTPKEKRRLKNDKKNRN